MLTANFKSNGIAAAYVSIKEPPLANHTDPLTTTCQIKTELIVPQNKLLLNRLTVGVMRKTRSMVISINAFTGSRNKFVAATIDTGKRY